MTRFGFAISRAHHAQGINGEDKLGCGWKKHRHPVILSLGVVQKFMVYTKKPVLRSIVPQGRKRNPDVEVGGVGLSVLERCMGV